jgi:hypothetical protein
VLLHNTDRHPGHFLFGPHWARAGHSPILIDHAAGFRKGSRVKMQDDDAFGSRGISCVRASTYLRLKLLSPDAIAAAVKPHLTNEELLGLLHRREGVLAYLDGLVEKQGVEATVLADS